MSDAEHHAPVRLDRTVIYESRWVSLYRDRVALPTGRVLEQYHVLDLGLGAVVAIVQNPEHSILLELVPRYPTGQSTWELPAGRVEQGETALEAARREVLEETGYATSGHERVYVYYPLDGMSSMTVSVVTCEAGDRIGSVDPDEVRELRWFTAAEITDMLRRREITCGLALVALLLHLDGPRFIEER